jgi:hypothetical protein
VTATLPDLEILDQNGRLLKPKVIVNSPESKTFVFDTTIKNIPWFILKEAQIKLSNGKILTIPKTKFVLVDEFALNLMYSIAP